MKNLICFLSILAVTHSFAGVEEYTDCIETMKQFRGNNHFEYNSFIIPGRVRDLKQGSTFSEEYNDLKLQNLCLNSKFQQTYKESAQCASRLLDKYTNNKIEIVTYNSGYKRKEWKGHDNGIMLSTKGVFNYCKSIVNENGALNKIETCLDGAIRSLDRQGETKIFAYDSNGYNYFSHAYTFNGYPKDNLLELCSKPKYIELFTSDQYKKINRCYLKKLSAFHYANNMPAPLTSGDSDETKMINLAAFSERLPTRDHTDLFIDMYDHCANSKVNNLELYKYYLHPGFITCIEQTNHESPINERESICATVMDENDLAEIEKLSSAKDDIIAKAPEEVDNSETEEDSSWWSWLFGPSSSSSKSSQE